MFARSLTRAPLSSSRRPVAARARVQLAVSADAAAPTAWKVAKPEQVNVRESDSSRCTCRPCLAPVSVTVPLGSASDSRKATVAAELRACEQRQPLIRGCSQALINDKGYVVLDIRTSAEYRKGNGLHWCASLAPPVFFYGSCARGGYRACVDNAGSRRLAGRGSRWLRRTMTESRT